jgi:hypothetical protein
MQEKALETMVEMRRQELRDVASAGLGTRRRRAGTEEASEDGSATQRSAAGVPVPGGRAVRRAVAPRLGTWLIHAGVRLGGASVRTS